jgi:hypothetical protein
MVQMNVETGSASLGSPPAAASLQVSDDWPVRSGVLPALADRFTARPESSPDLNVALDRSAVIALTPRARRAGAGSPHDLLRCTGKTQLAVYHAESLWRARALDLLVWIDGSSRASILTGYVEAVGSLTGILPQGPAEPIAMSLLSWLRDTSRRWLIVLDDVPNIDVLQGLWPQGAAGKLVITTPNSQAVAGLRDVHAVEIGPFSPREAMSYLVGRLSADPDQRRGAIDLIEDLGCQPLALAQATATIVSSWLTCTDYRGQFYRRMGDFTSSGGPPPAAALPGCRGAAGRARDPGLCVRGPRGLGIRRRSGDVGRPGCRTRPRLAARFAAIRVGERRPAHRPVDGQAESRAPGRDSARDAARHGGAGRPGGSRRAPGGMAIA